MLCNERAGRLKLTTQLPAMNFDARIDNLCAHAELTSRDVLYITSIPNIRYLSGFAGSAAVLLITGASAELVVDPRYKEAAMSDCASSQIDVLSTESSGLDTLIAKRLRGSRRLVVDPKQISVEDYWRLTKLVGGVDVVTRSGLPEQLRLSKDAAEVERVRSACRIALDAFSGVPQFILANPTEREVANYLEHRMKELGADGIAFDTIVASGTNSSRPHSMPDGRRILESDPVVIDFGAIVDGYHCDITRTVWFGDLNESAATVVDHAVAAHHAELAAMSVGATHAEVDGASRFELARRGFDRGPLHPSGHNVGLEIHERPFLSPYANELILENYVLAVEPGVYVPEVCGARIEDTVLVTPGGVEILSEVVK